jgi:DNA primase
VRDQYLMVIADRCRIEVDRLRDQLRSGRRPRSDRGDRSDQRAEAPPTRRAVGARLGRNTPALEALRILTHRRDEIAGLVDECLFDDELHVSAFRALTSGDDLRVLIDECDPATADLLQQLAVQESEADATDVAIRLLDVATRRAIADIEAEARHAADVAEYVPTLRWLKERHLELRDHDPQRAPLEQLLAWHRQRAIGD